MRNREIDLSKYTLVQPETIEYLDGIKTFYDIEVEDDNTFHIVGKNGDLILSHNCDGDSITALLINFFNKYWPDIFDKNMLYRVETPILVAIPKTKGKAKDKILFYSQNEYNVWLLKNDVNNYEIKYKKGLAALVDDEYNNIINNPRLIKITKNDISDSHLETWFGKSSELRKIELLKSS